MMWKIAVVTMLLATCAFGKVSLIVTPGAEKVDATGQATFTLSLVGNGEAVGNFSTYPVADNPADVHIANRVAMSALTEVVTDLATLQGATLDADNTVDLGLLHPTKNATITVNGKVDVMTVTFQVSDQSKLPIKIDLLGGAWAGGGGQGGDSMDDASLIINPIPEPASLSLLAAAAAFFARRRRA